VSRYQKGKNNLDFTEARDSEWQWHQLGHTQVCTSLQTDNHANTPPLSFLPPNQQRQSTENSTVKRKKINTRSCATAENNATRYVSQNLPTAAQQHRNNLYNNYYIITTSD